MTKKLWFQLGVGILLSLLIVKFFVEIKWIFSPLGVVAKSIFIPLLIGGVLFYITLPLQTLLEKWRFPRWASMISVFLVLLGVLFAAFMLVGPPIVEQTTHLIKNAPDIADSVSIFIIDTLEKVGSLPPWANDAIDGATEYFEALSLNIGKFVLSFFQSVFQGTLILVLVPFFLLFMLKDHDKFIPFISQFFSGKTDTWVRKVLKDVNEVLSLYIRGQILISAILAIMLFTGYKLIGLNFALLLAVFALFMNIIPFIGPWIALIPALLIAVFQDPSLGLVLWVCIITLVAQQTDANLITPNIMGKTLSIHPLTIITLIFAAGNLAGFLGILLAVPVYAAGKSIVNNIYEQRRTIKSTANKTV